MTPWEWPEHHVQPERGEGSDTCSPSTSPGDTQFDQHGLQDKPQVLQQWSVELVQPVQHPAQLTFRV